MSQYPPYPEYKASGVDWLGDVPAGWEVKRLKQLVEEPLSYGANASSENYDPAEPRYIRITDIAADGALREDSQRSLPIGIAKPYILLDGDILLARSGATVGKSFMYKKYFGQCCYAGYLICARVHKKIALPSFIILFTQSYGYWQYISSIQIQATIQNISAEKYNELLLPLPSLPEQEAIAAFLDRETGRIDELVHKKKSLIEKLKEQRTAVISAAVTKGLPPEVAPRFGLAPHTRFKPSGVDWLGDVPEGWEAKPLKHCSWKIIDGTHATPTYVSDGIPFLRVTDISSSQNTDQGICWDSVARIPDEEHKELIKRCHPQKGDLLVSKNGTIGIPKLVTWDEEFSIFVSLCLIKLLKNCNGQYLLYYFKSSLPWTEIAIGGKTGTITNLHLDKIKEFKIPLPPLPEQEAIAAYLDEQTAAIDALVAKVEQAILALQEYRSTLITAAVTGKIDVRHAHPMQEKP